jgi:hypothetical protein
MIRDARSGGTVTPEAMADLQQLVHAGRVHVIEDVTITHVEPEGSRWALVTACGRRLPTTGILLATGSVVDVRKDALLRDLLSITPPDRVCEGVPVLQPGCRWPALADGTQLPLFVMGAMAQLVLGPNAGNLFGARVGAAQIAVALRDTGLFHHFHTHRDTVTPGPQPHAAERSVSVSELRLQAYVSAGGNPFACLADSGSECSESEAEEPTTVTKSGCGCGDDLPVPVGLEADTGVPGELDPDSDHCGCCGSPSEHFAPGGLTGSDDHWQ